MTIEELIEQLENLQKRSAWWTSQEAMAYALAINATITTLRQDKDPQTALLAFIEYVKNVPDPMYKVRADYLEMLYQRCKKNLGWTEVVNE